MSFDRYYEGIIDFVNSNGLLLPEVVLVILPADEDVAESIQDAICVSYFQNWNHKDHGYSIIYMGEGCCDCGDETPWKYKCFCSKHKDSEQVQPLYDNLANSVGPVFDALFICWKNKLFSTEVIFQENMRASDRGAEQRKVVNELRYEVVEVLLEFCKCSDSLLSLVYRRVISLDDLLDIRVRAERSFCNGDGVQQSNGSRITPLLGAWSQKLGSVTFPFLEVQPVIVEEKGVEMDGQCSGYLCAKGSWSGTFRTLYGDHERYETTYFRLFLGYCFTGDGCSRDQDEYHWLTRRVNDAFNVSGRRIRTAAVESALVSHLQCAEAVVVGVEHEVEGQGIYAFVTLVEGISYGEEPRRSLILPVQNQIGAFTVPNKICEAPIFTPLRSVSTSELDANLVQQLQHDMQLQRDIPVQSFTSEQTKGTFDVARNSIVVYWFSLLSTVSSPLHNALEDDLTTTLVQHYCQSQSTVVRIIETARGNEALFFEALSKYKELKKPSIILHELEPAMIPVAVEPNDSPHLAKEDVLIRKPEGTQHETRGGSNDAALVVDNSIAALWELVGWLVIGMKASQVLHFQSLRTRIVSMRGVLIQANLQVNHQVR